MCTKFSIKKFPLSISPSTLHGPYVESNLLNGGNAEVMLYPMIH
jgi:hypothetical protein